MLTNLNPCYTMKRSLFLMGLLLHTSIFAQTFVNVASQQGLNVVNSASVLGSGMSFYDYNDDGWPDLSYCQNGVGIVRYLNNEGSFESDGVISLSMSDSKSVTYADYDNDGDADMLITRRNNSPILLRNDCDCFVDVSVEAGMPIGLNPASYGACWGDFDKDGYLDCYIANYNWNAGPHNWLLHNNGDGTFSECAVESGVDNGQKPSFQAVFTDINKDTWPDLFLINDKEPTNVLYLNLGDGTFIDVSAERNLDFEMDAMSNSITDFDRDGDLDIYVTNDQLGNVLHRNDDGWFTDVTEEHGLEVGALCWGAAWMDYDNNGYDDLYVLTTYLLNNNQNYFYKNGGPSGFALDNPFPGNQNQFPGYSPVCADFNRDGFVDIACNNMSPMNTILWRNQATSANSSCTVHLNGVVSNSDAVGTWLSAHVGNNVFDFYTSSGGNYLGQNNQDVLVPLPQGVSLDSLIVLWPSGHEDRFYNLAPLSYNSITEGSTFQATVEFEQSQACFGDSIYVEILGDGSALWNDGLEGNSRYITTSGIYSATLTNEFGITSSTNEYAFVIHPEMQAEVLFENPSCVDSDDGQASVMNTSESIEQVLWSNDSTDLSINNLSEGEYYLDVFDEFQCSQRYFFELELPDSITFTYLPAQVSCFGENDGSLMINPSGGTGNLEIVTFGEDFTALGVGSYPFMIVDENACVLIDTLGVWGPSAINSNPVTLHPTETTLGSIDLNLSGGSPPYEVYWSNGATGEQIEDLGPGFFSANVFDDAGCSYTESFVLEMMVGIEEENHDSRLIYPNPASQHINLPKTLRNSSYKIYNTLGQLVSEGTLMPSKNSIDVQDLKEGSYMLYLYGETLQGFRFLVDR